MFFYVGFTLGTALCALAPNYHVLLSGRIVTGLFGGVIGSIVLAIVTDLFALHLRGRVMGFVQTAFAASQVLGIPVGLFLSNHWNWHVAFGALVGLSIVAMAAVLLVMKPVNEHLRLKQDKNAFRHLIATVGQPRYSLAFAVTTLLATGGFMLMPFGSAYTVHNLGIDIVHLPTIYLVSGLFSIFMGPLVGKAERRVRQISHLCLRQRGVGRDGADLHAPRSGHLDDRDRRQRPDVRRHLFAHDSVAGADFGDSRTQSTRLLQRGQRFPAAALRRARVGSGRGDHRPECRRVAQAFRPAGIRRRCNDADFADRDVFRAEAVANQAGKRVV